MIKTSKYITEAAVVKEEGTPFAMEPQQPELPPEEPSIVLQDVYPDLPNTADPCALAEFFAFKCEEKVTMDNDPTNDQGAV